MENAWNPLPHGVGQSVGMTPNREFPCNLSVPSRGNKFCCRCDKAIGSQWPGLLDYTFLGWDISDTADKQVGRLLVQFFGRLILQHPFVLLVDQDILLGRGFNGEYGNVCKVDAEQPL